MAISRYKFSERLYDYIKALEVEQNILAETWSKAEFVEREKLPNGNYVPRITRSGQLAIEAVEYFFLTELSTFLADYFNGLKSNNRNQVIEMGREDIPAVLINNRFIELFSRPIEDREIFSQTNLDSDGILIAAFSNGAIYDNVRVTLPKGAKVVRPSHGKILIRSRRLSLETTIDIDQGSAVLPHNFENFYLNCDFGDVNAYHFLLSIDLSIPFWSFLIPHGWHYYEWIDGFLGRLESNTSFEDFLRTVGWDVACTVETMRRGAGKPRRSGVEVSMP